MLIPRDPMSVFGAIALVIETLGGKRVAAALGVAKVTVYRWSNENESGLPDILEAVRLDAFWIAQTKGPVGKYQGLPQAGMPIILPAMLRHLREVTGAPEDAGSATVCAATVTQETMGVGVALGCLTEAVMAASRDGSISESERLAMRRAAARVFKEIGDVLQATKPARKRK